ncbi:MAG: hypothetical protein ACP5U1_06120, partial [Desulfomonilaceae bacterium]
EKVSLSFENFRKIMTPVMESEYFWQSLMTFFRLGEAIFLRWLTAAIFLSISLGIVAYLVTYLIQKKRLYRVARNLSDEYQNLALGLHTADYDTNLKNNKIPQ